MLKLVFKAYQSLRLLFDPAVEGNPYQSEQDRKLYKNNRINKSIWTYLTEHYVIQGA
jgi:hypothetical protein